MFEIIEEYVGEIIIVIAMAVLRLFGRNKTADEIATKLKAKREKRIAAQEKKLNKDVEKAKADAEKLEKLKKENENA